MADPNWQEARVERKKIADYLLNEAHPDGKSKAHFFLSHGFDLDEWQKFANTLRNHALDNAVNEIVRSAYGTKFVIEGPVTTPRDVQVHVRTVWILDRDSTDNKPRFVTAYPI